VDPIAVALDGGTTSFNVTSTDGYIIQVTGDGLDVHGHELSWELREGDGTLHHLGFAGEAYSTCPPPPPSPCELANNTLWTLQMMDSWGDGWNGNEVSISDCDGNSLTIGAESYTLDADHHSIAELCLAESDGYTITVGGGNYEGEVSWRLMAADGTVLTEGGAGESTYPPEFQCPVPPFWGADCSENSDNWDSDNSCCTVDFAMMDSYGDGWNDNEAIIYDCTGAQLAGPFTVVDGAGAPGDADATVPVCLGAGNGYRVNVDGGDYPGEISWTLNGDGGGAPGDTYVGTCGR